MRVLELADALRKYGLTVVEVAGWRTHGNEFPVRPDGAVRHWTAGPVSGLTPSLNTIINGRGTPGQTGYLPGPLAQVYQSRATDANGLDIVYLVASGKANHAGNGSWNGIVGGNYQMLGLEIEWSGPGEAFEGVRQRKLTSELVMRALMDCVSGSNPGDACEHREWAPTRKIDTNLSGNELRMRMADLASAIEQPNEEEDEMMMFVRSPAGAVFLFNGETLRPANNQTYRDILMFLGMVPNTPSDPWFNWEQAQIDAVREVSPTTDLLTADQIAAKVIARMPAYPECPDCNCEGGSEPADPEAFRAVIYEACVQALNDRLGSLG